jgi:antitoxin CcdA
MAKKPVNVSMEQDLLAKAKKLNVNISLASTLGVKTAVREAEEAAWKRENAEAIRAYNLMIENEGIWNEEFRPL